MIDRPYSVTRDLKSFSSGLSSVGTAVSAALVGVFDAAFLSLSLEFDGFREGKPPNCTRGADFLIYHLNGSVLLDPSVLLAVSTKTVRERQDLRGTGIDEEGTGGLLFF